MRQFLSIIRWNDWGPGKLPVFFTLGAFIALTCEGTSNLAQPTGFPLFVLFAALNSALGYLINDWGDREIDASQGKPNAFEHLSFAQSITLLAATALACIATSLPFLKQPGFVWLWAGWTFVTFAYSLKPIRLKEMGAPGLVLAACAQWTLPVFITFCALGCVNLTDMFVFAAISTVSGITLEISHQRYDRQRDLSTRTSTFGTRVQGDWLTKLYRFALTLEKAVFCALLVWIVSRVGNVSEFGYPLWLGLCLLASFVVLCLMQWPGNRQAAARGDCRDPYYGDERNALTLIHHSYPNVFLPSYLLLLATFAYPLNAIVLLSFLVWRAGLAKADWTWPLRVVFPKGFGG